MDLQELNIGKGKRGKYTNKQQQSGSGLLLVVAEGITHGQDCTVLLSDSSVPQP